MEDISSITSAEAEAFAAKFTGWTQQLTDRERVMLGTAIAASRDEPGGAGPTVAVIPTVGPVIGAVLEAIAAVIVMIGQVEAKGLEDEADAKEREAGMNDTKGRHLGRQSLDRIQSTRRRQALGLPDDD